MHEAMSVFFRRWADWETAAEVTFSVYGERGSIDLLAYHRPTRRLLVIELKTLIVDVQGLLAQIDRYRRLAAGLARDRGWEPSGVSVWVVVAESRTNRRRLTLHRNVLRTALPVDGHTMRQWLAAPDRDIAALSLLAATTPRTVLRVGRKRASGRTIRRRTPVGG